MNVYYFLVIVFLILNLGLNLYSLDYLDKGYECIVVGWLCYFEDGVLDDFSYCVILFYFVYIVMIFVIYIYVFMGFGKCFCFEYVLKDICGKKRFCKSSF